MREKVSVGAKVSKMVSLGVNERFICDIFELSISTHRSAQAGLEATRVVGSSELSFIFDFSPIISSQSGS